MAYILCLEAICDDTVAKSRLYAGIAEDALPGYGAYLRIPSRAWVAEITGRDPKYGLARSFVHGKKDYSQSNSVGSRGVKLWYELWPGRVYDVSHPVCWKRTRRYFCRVEGNGLCEMTKEEVLEWLDTHSASTS